MNKEERKDIGNGLLLFSYIYFARDNADKKDSPSSVQIQNQVRVCPSRSMRFHYQIALATPSTRVSQLIDEGGAAEERWGMGTKT